MQTTEHWLNTESVSILLFFYFDFKSGAFSTTFTIIDCKSKKEVSNTIYKFLFLWYSTLYD